MLDTLGNNYKIPCGKHKPVIKVNYENIDKEYSGGDAKFIDLGQASWNNEEYSAKVCRTCKGNLYNPKCEELPLGRVLDLAILISATITKKQSILNEQPYEPNEDKVKNLNEFLEDNISVLGAKLNELRRILQPPQTTPEEYQEKSIPNIFSFATSELSQDAMIAWLLSWADKKYSREDEQLHEVAQSFVKLLTNNEDLDIKQIKVSRQVKNIDIVAEINDNTILIIEDKTNTTIHDKQLEKYKVAIEDQYHNHEKYFVYVKTGNEPKSILNKVDESGYETVLRDDILTCLKKYQGNNILLCNFIEYLQKIEDETLSFQDHSVNKWSRYAWEGFFKKLENEININDWNYVSNESGGFLGAWWCFKDFPGGKMYLQFEQEKLCFKIAPNCEVNDRSIVRNNCSQLLIENADKSMNITKPQRFGCGAHMTIAQISPKDIFGNEKIDLEKIKNIITKCENLIENCCKKLQTKV